MHPIVPWLPVLLLPLFAAFFCLIIFLVSRMGWSRLAQQYAVEEVPATVGWMLLAYLRIGVANYKNTVRAGVTPQGLWLSTWKIFFIGHPPLFIPWSAFGSVRVKKFLWTRTCSTTINCHGDYVSFKFTSDLLLNALPSSIQVEA